MRRSLICALFLVAGACAKPAVRVDPPIVESARPAPKPVAAVASTPSPVEEPAPVEPAPVAAPAPRKPQGPPVVRFAFNSWYIDEPSREALKVYAEELQSGAGRTTVRIEGHADERGTSEFNMVLGQKRASEVRTYLSRSGVSATRLQALSFGEDRPIDRRSTEDAWATNRRAEVKETTGIASR